MTFGSLFAGIGGMDLGLERAGMTCKWQVEIDPFCRKVLAKHWPEVPKYEDVRTVGAELESVDLIAGGFPCQDISLQGAVWGKRKGLSGERSGLFFELARVVSLVRPRFILLENVAAILDNGMGDVLGRLASLGYDSEWDCLPASAFGAPHRRDRLFLVAYYRGQRMQRLIFKEVPRVEAFQGLQNVRSVEDLRERSDLPPSIFRGSGDGVPDWMGRVRGCGNAVCPPVAEWIGQRIMEAAR